MWIKCAPKGDIYVMYPRADGSNPHASYHRDGTFHHKSYGTKSAVTRQLQPLDDAFTGSEHLGGYGGHGKSTGAVCDRDDFDGLVIVEPGILGPIHGSVVVDVAEPGYEPTRCRDFRRQVFRRPDRPSVVITIARHDQVIPFLRWPDDFERTRRANTSLSRPRLSGGRRTPGRQERRTTHYRGATGAPAA